MVSKEKFKMCFCCYIEGKKICYFKIWYNRVLILINYLTLEFMFFYYKILVKYLIFDNMVIIYFIIGNLMNILYYWEK